MSAPSPSSEPGTGAPVEADDHPAEGATSEQVLHAQDGTRAEGEPVAAEEPPEAAAAEAAEQPPGAAGGGGR